MKRWPPPVLLDEARDEFLEAAGWYEGQRAGLGRRFISAVETALDSVQRNPFLNQTVHGEVRRALVDRFPYGVFFVIEDQRLRVLSISHLSRDPHHWHPRR